MKITKRGSVTVHADGGVTVDGYEMSDQPTVATTTDLTNGYLLALSDAIVRIKLTQARLMAELDGRA